MTLWDCWTVVRLFLIPMIGGISYKRRQWLIWGYGDTRLPSLRTRGPKCHTSRAEMSHKQGQNVTQGPNCHKSHVIINDNTWHLDLNDMTHTFPYQQELYLNVKLKSIFSTLEILLQSWKKVAQLVLLSRLWKLLIFPEIETSQDIWY